MGNPTGTSLSIDVSKDFIGMLVSEEYSFVM